MHRLIFLAVLFILPPAPGITQDSTIAKADSLFDQKSFSEAARLYQQIATEYRDKLRAEKGRYRHYYVLYRIAVSHQRAGHSGYYMYYRRFMNEYYRSLEFYKEKHDTRVYLLLADAYAARGDFFGAAEQYSYVLAELDSLSNEFAFAYAVSVMCSGYYGHARELFQKIGQRQEFEPQYSSYLKKCTDSSGSLLTDQLAWGDTLILEIFYDGCFGDDEYRYDFIKRPFGTQVIVYENRQSFFGDNKPWKIEKDTMLSPGMFAQVAALEKKMRHFFPEFSSFSSLTGYYSIRTRAGRFLLSDYGQLVGYMGEFMDLLE